MKYFLTLLLAASATLLYAQQPGTVDKSYGNSNGADIVKDDGGRFSSAIQPDDKLVTGGIDDGGYNLLLSRHNKDGSIDSSFGTNGTVTSSYDKDIYVFGFGFGWVSTAIQPDGKIVCTGVGSRYGPGGDTIYNSDILVARFLPDGTPDNSFGTNGLEITDIGYTESSYALALQPDGKIVVGGQFNNKLLVLRYNTDGSPDKGFGNGTGYVLSTAAYSAADAIAVQPDDKIVAGGSSDINRYFFIERFLPDGTVDNSFGENGSTSFSDGSYSALITSLALDGTGRIVASGNALSVAETGQIVVIRYLPDGTPDNSFDGDGKEYITFPGSNGYNYSTAVLLPNPDKIVVAGHTFTDNPTADFALAALNAADGSVDSAFGINGQATANFGYNEATYGAVLQSDGKIVLTASDQYNEPFPYINARFNGYPVHVSLAVRIKRWLQNHTLSWNGLPAEDKIAYYSVEQSSNSSKGFTQIAKVSGSSNLRDYSITNSSLLQGMNYYRVKAVSTDGVVRYSEVVSADNTANTASVFPNPAKDYVLVKGLPANTTANISIADGSGNVRVRSVSNGSEQYRSQLTNMQPGTYYVNITTATKTEVLKLVKE